MFKERSFTALLCFGVGLLWPISGATASLHRFRIDLKVRSPDLLREKAEAMSKPFPHHGKPLSWKEIIEVAGRTPKEMESLVLKITNSLGGQNVKECPSRQCIVADFDDDDDEMPLDGIFDEENNSNGGLAADAAGDFLDRRLRGLLDESGHDHTIINRVTHLWSPEENEDNGEFKRRRMGIDYDGDAGAAPSNPAQSHYNLPYISQAIVTARRGLTEESLYNAANYQSVVAIPAICGYDDDTDYVSMENENRECPTIVNVTAYAWYAEDLAVSNQVTFGLSTEDMAATITCSEYNVSVCKNDLSPFMKVAATDANVTLKFREDTTLRFLELGQHLADGIGFYHVVVEYPEWGITLDLVNGLLGQTATTGYQTAPGPMITPQYGNEKYNVPEGHQGQGLGVTALYGNNYYTPEALEAFLEGFDLPVPEIQLLSSSLFQGGNNATYCLGGACGESQLDIQMITSYGTGADFGFIAGVGPPNGEDIDVGLFVQYREAFIEADVAPDVLSLSYGGASSGSNATYLQDLEDIMMEFTSAGITVLVATGDRGATDGQFVDSPCTPTEVNDYTFQLPVTSQWALAVGGTMEAYSRELDDLTTTACMGNIGQQITSTGYILTSDVIELPEYQKEAVEGYLSSDTYQHWPFQPGTISTPGRGIPDVSAYGNDIPLVNVDADGNLTVDNAGGTSASSPAFAGLLLQVRGALLSAPECEGIDVKFGHINPMIYWAAENRPDAFTDITIGNNLFDGQKPGDYVSSNCGYGFPTTEGWDATTGVGQMNFPGFVDAAIEYYCVGIDG